LLLASLVVLGGVTRADASPADAEALIQQGVELRRNKKDQAALKLFEQAYAMDKSPKAAAQIGLAEQALGQWARAARRLQEALASKSDPWINKNRSALEEGATVVGRHVGHLEVTGTPLGAEVVVDGEIVGRLPLSEVIPANAGTVAVQVRAPGYLTVTRGASVSAGELTRESVDLQSLSPEHSATSGPALRPARQEQPPPQGQDSSHAQSSPEMGVSTAPKTQDSNGGGGVGTRRWLAYGSGGLAGVSLVLGVVEQLAWQSKVSSFNDNAACDQLTPARGGAGCQGLYDDGQRARQLSFVGYGLGVGLAATAVVLLLTEPDRPVETAKVAVIKVEAPQIACALLGARGGFGCSFRF
jgi:hypothetical protein